MSIPEQHIRTAMLLGEDALTRLSRAHVAIFGIGGVGGYICEALARAGIGTLELFDHDTVSLSNINRQIIATHKTVGEEKVLAMAERIASINPACRVIPHATFYTPENAADFDFSSFDYIADAIDTVKAKIALAVRAKEENIPIIAAMGTGNKTDPTRFRVADISKTDTCPLAKVMRVELRRRGITHMKVLYSTEPPRTPIASIAPPDTRPGKVTPASLSTLPSVAGLIMANEILMDLSGFRTAEGAR